MRRDLRVPGRCVPRRRARTRAARARGLDYYRWLFFAAGPLEAAVTNRSLGVEVPEDKAGFVGYGCLERVVDALESAVAGREFIAGDAFSAADVYVGSQIGWGMQFGTVEKRPAFEAYWARIGQRPARRRADALDDAQLAASAAQPAVGSA